MILSHSRCEDDYSHGQNNSEIDCFARSAPVLCIISLVCDFSDIRGATH